MRTKLIVFIIVLALGTIRAVGWLGYQLFSTGFSAKTEPHALEVLIARQIRHLAIPLKQRNAPNPIPLNPDVIKESLAHFADHCATCHANAAVTSITASINENSRNLQDIARQMEGIAGTVSQTADAVACMANSAGKIDQLAGQLASSVERFRV